MKDIEALASRAVTSRQRTYYRRVLAGLCIDCSYTAAPNRRRCEVCGVRHMEREEAAAKRHKLMRLMQEQHYKAAMHGYWPENARLGDCEAKKEVL